jgi:hypothetical protein
VKPSDEIDCSTTPSAIALSQLALAIVSNCAFASSGESCATVTLGFDSGLEAGALQPDKTSADEMPTTTRKSLMALA